MVTAFRVLAVVAVLTAAATGVAAGDKVYGVEISPSGKYYAVLRDMGDQHALAVYAVDDPAAAPKGIGLGAIAIEDLEWGGEDHVLVRFSGEKGGLDTVQGLQTLEFQRWMSISRETGKSSTLFGNEAGADYYYFIASAGQLLASNPAEKDRAVFARSFPQVSTLGPSRLKQGQDQLLYSLQSANLNSGDVKREAEGDKNTIDWIVDAAGKPVARIDQFEATKKIEVMAANVSGRGFTKAGEFPGEQVVNEQISFLGVGASPRSIQVLRNQGDGQFLMEYDLDSGAFKPDAQFVGGVSRVVYDPREARTRVIHITGAGGERVFHVDSADQKTQTSLEKAVAGAAISIVSRSVDGTRLIARADFAGKGPEFYLFDKAAKRLELVAASEEQPALHQH